MGGAVAKTLDEAILRRASLALNKAASDGKNGIKPDALNPFRNSEDQRRLVRGVLQRLQETSELSEVTATDLDALVSQLVGLGPLDALVGDSSVVSVQVLAHDRVLAYRGGVWERADGVAWPGPEALRSFAYNLANLIGQSLDTEHMVVEGNFNDPPGRIQIDSAARTPAGVTLHLRMGRRNPITLAQMLADGGMSQAVFNFITEIARRDVGVLIVGLPGTGKTTLLEACMDHWPLSPAAGLDDRSEFWPRHPFCTLYDVPSEKLSGALVDVLRKNVTRVAVAEVRGNEAAEMLRYSGALTVWTTLHGNVNNATLRLMALVQGAPDSPYANLPEDTVRRVIASAFPILIESEKYTVGGRASFFISEVAHLDEQGIARPVYQAELDGPRLVGFPEKMRPDAVLSKYRRRIWGGVSLPSLAAIAALSKRLPGVCLASLGEYLRAHPNEPQAVALLKRIAAQDPIHAWINTGIGDYEARVRDAEQARDWASLMSLRSQLDADPALTAVTGGYTGKLSIHEVARRAALVAAAREVMGMSDDPRNVTALVGLMEQVRIEPDVYPEGMGDQVMAHLATLPHQDCEGAALHLRGLSQSSIG